MLRLLWAGATFAAAVAVVAWIGLDAWIVAVWALLAGVGLVLWILGRLLARELDVAGPARTHRPSWWAGGVGAFVSCTMAAALVRSGAPLRDFWLLGGLMVMAVTSLRLAYHSRQA